MRRNDFFIETVENSKLNDIGLPWLPSLCQCCSVGILKLFIIVNLNSIKMWKRETIFMFCSIAQHLSAFITPLKLVS